ncbi:TPA: CRTAC1 family protein, partial [Candidatus Poribacteria bacterium]|nr:CRTAC1 family protein [Candidatus Poribacteria bacterium]
MSRTGKISFPYLGWATFFFDYDNDGLQDLYVANGHLHENLSELGQEGTYPQPDLIFKNNGDGSFTEIADQLGDVYRPTVSRGAAWADYDLDGDVDMIATNSNGRPKLLRNDGGNANQWISFNVDGIAIGTRITVQTGDILQTKEIGNQSGYLSQSEKRLHFGLGSTKQVDLITVRHPNGKMQQLSQVKTN